MMWLYESFQNYGLAVIVFALIVKLILLPFQMKSKKESAFIIQFLILKMLI